MAGLSGPERREPAAPQLKPPVRLPVLVSEATEGSWVPPGVEAGLPPPLPGPLPLPNALSNRLLSRQYCDGALLWCCDEK